MRLIDAISVEKTSRIAFVGAGGKTTAMFRLARQAKTAGMDLIFCSATTHLAEEQLELADQHIILNTMDDLHRLDAISAEGVVLLTGPLGEDGRTKGLSLELISEVDKLASRYHAALLIEADGARCKPLKAPADHEPVIPPWVERVVVVVGMSGLGKPLTEEVVHRPDIFGELAGLQRGEVISIEALSQVLLSEAGGMKGIPSRARRIVILNQCDDIEKAAQGKLLSEKLKLGYGQVILSKLAKSSPDEVIAVNRRIAGIILAAGGSVRMGQPKQLLDWHGKAFVRAVAETALSSGLAQVIVVTGAYQNEVDEALEGLHVVLRHNPDWTEGQASSVRKAIESLSPADQDVYGVIFFLVDQPQISVALVQSLLDTYHTSLSPIVAPLINDRRGNPVLFDQMTFGELSQLTGDAGGRQVFSRFEVNYIPWLDDKMGLDVDTLEDYKRLLRDE
ncbi:MAG: selenium cofactor biosynthesis protein YqeC [Anaerolineales bacterium]